MTTLIIPVISNTPVQLTAIERKNLNDHSKEFETILTNLTSDVFTQQHEKARREEYTKYGNAQFCTDINGDVNFKYDRQFSSPKERYENILKNIKYYQQPTILEQFEKDENDKFNANITRRKKELDIRERQLQKEQEKLEQDKANLQNDIENRDIIIRKNIIQEVLYKINFFKSLYKESQEVHTKSI